MTEEIDEDEEFLDKCDEDEANGKELTTEQMARLASIIVQCKTNLNKMISELARKTKKKGQSLDVRQEEICKEFGYDPGA